MIKKNPVAAAALSLMVGIVIGMAFDPRATGYAQPDKRVFEIRTYYTHPGKLDALNARFRNHTVKFFEKHGMTNVGYWVPADPPQSENTLIYIVAHQDREAAKKSWDAFRKDPDWLKVRTESEAQGPINTKVESVFLTPTDYSPMK